jgi:cytochrome c
MLRFFRIAAPTVFNKTGFITALFCMMLMLACNKRSGKARVLVFSKTSGYHHSSIPNGIAAVQKLGSENNFTVDTTTEGRYFTEDSLKNYAAVIFLNTTEDVLNSQQEAEFERYIQSGGGFVGVHAATDTEYDWGWYGRLVGAYFSGHPEQQEAVINVVDANHAATKHLPKQWRRKDEWYNFKKLDSGVHVLLTIDEGSYKGGTNGGNHPMAWYHEFDGGRSFYTELGHTEESYADPLYLKHLLAGIQYAIGENKALDYDNAKTAKVPDEDRFVKTVLNQGNFFEPTEMAILPNLDILISQRRGELMYYNSNTKEVKQAGFLNVYHQTNTPGVNAEEGILGLTADPDFGNNHYIYVFYSPIDTSVNRLSRFEFNGDTLDKKTEKVVLQFYSQREICCHTGGSIAFGADRMLYLSTGDNSTPFDEPKNPYANHGFAPLDDRPGKEQYDARRSSGNSNDLRGKVLRIRIKEDGTYEIPKGNLFEDGKQGRPEIYTMGHRNPYRLSVDKKTGYVYWGEVGPDSGTDSLETRGPRGYDEVNQARRAGFYGWPLIIGNNYPYRQHDYATGQNGEPFDPMKPINASRNNTGLQALPPAIPAFIWYPYALSKDFPQMGTGGRNAMAGPVYYTEDFPKATRYPDYFNGKLFIYEWMRNFIKVVRMFPNGDFDKMDAFMSGTQLSSPIDMEVGPDGRLYILEYGKGWFSKNADAGISRIDYIAGNRPPKVDSLVVEKESGALPYTLTATVKANDPENDKLKYIWTIGNVKQETAEPRLQHTITKGGEYTVGVEVVDDEKAASRSSEITVYAGNEQPQVDIELAGNKSFYFTGKPIQYTVKIKDKGDSIDKNNVFVKSDFVESNEDLAAQGHQVVPDEIMGKNLMAGSDCKSCHKVDEKSIGPAYIAVAQRYQKDPKASTYLINKIIKGGAGAWGDVAMPAHPTMKEGDVKLITTYILSLAGDGLAKKSLPLAGKVQPTGAQTAKGNLMFTLTASYTDAGANGVRPLSGSKIVFLRNPTIDAGHLRDMTGFTTKDSSGSRYLIFPAAEGVIKGAALDLSGIRSLEFTGFGMGEAGRYNIEIHTGSATGPTIGKGEISFGVGSQKVTTAVPVQNNGTETMQDIYVVVRSLQTAGNNRPLLKWIRFVPGSGSPIAMRR